MRTCTKGDKCHHKDGPELPDSEFYPYSKRCRACHRAYAKHYIAVDEYCDNEARIAMIRAIAKSRRPARLYKWIRDKEINIKEFCAIIKNVEI